MSTLSAEQMESVRERIMTEIRNAINPFYHSLQIVGMDRGQPDSFINSAAHESAWLYADAIWQITFYKEILSVYGNLLIEVQGEFEKHGWEASLKALHKDDQKKQFSDKLRFEIWTKRTRKALEYFANSFKFAKVEVDLRRDNYEEWRATEGLFTLRPEFSIDVTENPLRLATQRNFDVEREARHIGATSLTLKEVKQLRDAATKRQFYHDSPLLQAEPDVTIYAEIAEVWTKLLDSYSQVPSELMFQDNGENFKCRKGVFLPTSIRDLEVQLKAVKEGRPILPGFGTFGEPLYTRRCTFGYSGLPANTAAWVQRQNQLGHFPLELYLIKQEKFGSLDLKHLFDLESTEAKKNHTHFYLRENVKAVVFNHILQKRPAMIEERYKDTPMEETDTSLDDSQAGSGMDDDSGSERVEIVYRGKTTAPVTPTATRAMLLDGSNDTDDDSDSGRAENGDRGNTKAPVTPAAAARHSLASALTPSPARRQRPAWRPMSRSEITPTRRLPPRPLPPRPSRTVLANAVIPVIGTMPYFSRWGRPAGPYNPTKQHKFHNPSTRGKPPIKKDGTRLDEQVWSKAFNAADCARGRKADRISAQADRESGFTRDDALDSMFKKGLIDGPERFRDIDY